VNILIEPLMKKMEGLIAANMPNEGKRYFEPSTVAPNNFTILNFVD